MLVLQTKVFATLAQEGFVGGGSAVVAVRRDHFHFFVSILLLSADAEIKLGKTAYPKGTTKTRHTLS